MKEENLQERIAFLEKMFTSFRNSVPRTAQSKEYLYQRKLDYNVLEIGYNAGQFHHGERKEDSLIKNCLQYGLLNDIGHKGNAGQISYQVFGKQGIVFPLKNKDNRIVSLYFRNTIDKENAKHFYLKNRQGLYPNYPKSDAKKLILTEAIIDAASLLQIKEITKDYEVLACYGTNGLTQEHTEAVSQLKNLEEIIFFFDGDKPGKEAIKKYANELMSQCANIKISSIETPDYEDVNSLSVAYEKEIFIELLQNRTPIFSSSEELKKVEKPKETNKPIIHQTNNIVDFLKDKNLLQNLNNLIGKAGIVGEENSRMLLFLVVISYRDTTPIHAIVQGSSGSGKSHMIKLIADMMPQEDVLRFTRITESSLYNWGEFDLHRKVIIIEDLDGLKEEALYSLRELISNQYLSSSVSIKDKKGNNKSAKKEVRGQFSSLSATTKSEIYADNMNRSIIIAVDESEKQTDAIVYNQNQIIAGEISLTEKKEALSTIQNAVRTLHHYEVQNSYASKIQLPDGVRDKRRLNQIFQKVIKLITNLHQYQRKQNKNNELITEIQDIEQAIEVLFESIMIKMDELDGSSRQFFEKIKKAFKEREFNRFEAMEVTGFKKTQLQHYLNELVRLEYLKQFGHGNKGYKYKIGYQDNNQLIREQIKKHFQDQINKLKTNTSEH